MIFLSSASTHLPACMIVVFLGLLLTPNFAASFCVLSVSSFMPFQEFSNRAISSAKSRSLSLSSLTHLIPVSFTLITLVITQSTTRAKINGDKTHPCRTPSLLHASLHIYCHHRSSEYKCQLSFVVSHNFSYSSKVTLCVHY